MPEIKFYPLDYAHEYISYFEVVILMIFPCGETTTRTTRGMDFPCGPLICVLYSNKVLGDSFPLEFSGLGCFFT